MTNFPAGTSAEWLGVGRGGRAAPPFVLGGVGACLSLARAVLPGRIAAERLIHYHIELAHTAPPPDGVRLAPVTDALVRRIHAHPDHTETELAAGLRWWEQGWRRAFVWLEDERPLCIQWLLTAEDNARLRTLEWGGMFPPLAPGCGQVEHLFTFSDARRKGVATQFEYAMYEEARRLGLGHLITIIHETNAASRRWADKTGWHAYGTITRYAFDLPKVRPPRIFLHRNGVHLRVAPAGGAGP